MIHGKTKPGLGSKVGLVIIGWSNANNEHAHSSAHMRSNLIRDTLSLPFVHLQPYMSWYMWFNFWFLVVYEKGTVAVFPCQTGMIPHDSVTGMSYKSIRNNYIS